MVPAFLSRVTRRNATALDIVIEQPRSPVIFSRVQRFAGSITSDTPLPELRFFIGGIEKTVHRYDAPNPELLNDGQRHSADWNFYHEFGSDLRVGCKPIALEAYVGTTCVLRKSYYPGRIEDRAGPMLVIPHIPKTAGTSLRVALEQQGAIRMLSLYYDRAFMPLDDCRDLSPAALDDIDVLFGHFPYNMHRISHRPYEYMTVLRHPADLLKSYYLFNKYLIRNDAYSGFGCIEEAIASCTDVTFDNAITRYLAGKVSQDPVSVEDFEVALANMERDFSYIGTVEAFPASFDAIGQRLGITLEPCVANVTPPSAEGDGIDRAWLLRRYSSNIEYDLRLYERAHDLFVSGPRPVACSRT